MIHKPCSLELIVATHLLAKSYKSGKMMRIKDFFKHMGSHDEDRRGVTRVKSRGMLKGIMQDEPRIRGLTRKDG